MSSVKFNDSSCTTSASKVSCDAMSSLAIDAYKKNRQYQSYLLQDPSCFRYQSLADRGDEHLLQKSLGIARNVCFEKTPEFQKGPWENQYAPQVDLPTFYEKWTRSKNQKLTCNNTNALIPCAPEPLGAFPGPQGFSFRA